jgi:hypothetical protein
MTRELDAGLVLRPVTADDAEALAALVGDVLRAQDDEQPNHRLAAWTIRAQFDEIHRLSAERGQQLLVISGIPWFHRQFG